MAGTRQIAPEAPQVMVRLFFIARRGEADHRKAARIERSGDPLDRSPFPGRIPTLHDAKGRDLLMKKFVFRLEEAHLEVNHVRLVVGGREFLRHLQRREAAPGCADQTSSSGTVAPRGLDVAVDRAAFDAVFAALRHRPRPRLAVLPASQPRRANWCAGIRTLRPAVSRCRISGSVFGIAARPPCGPQRSPARVREPIADSRPR